MSDGPTKLPPLSEGDWQAVTQMLIGLASIGVVVVDWHPSRWPLLVDGANRFGGGFPPDVDPSTITSLPFDLELDGHPIRCIVRRWNPDGEALPPTRRDAIAAQRYPTPEPEPLIVEPDRRTGIIMPGDPRARKVH